MPNRPVWFPIQYFLGLDDVVQIGDQNCHAESTSRMGLGGQFIEGCKLPAGFLRCPDHDIDIAVVRPPSRYLVMTESAAVKWHLHRTFRAWYSKTGIHGAQSAGQRIEIMRLPARHDIDVECGSRRTVRDRCEPANQHIGDSMPVEEAHEGFGVERWSVGVTHGEVGPPER